MSLTTANSVITLSQSVLFPTPVQLQNFSADEITDIENAQVLEHQMGVDGVLSFGFVWRERMQTISLKGDSASVAFFDTINLQQEAAQDAYTLNGTIIVPGLGKMWTLTNGGLETYKPMPRLGKVTQAQSFRIVWGRVQVVNTR